MQTIFVDLPRGKDLKEADYRDALVRALKDKGEHARTEVAFKGGRCDIVTSKYAIEVDRAKKWHEAIGQAIHYAIYLKKRPCIALFKTDALSSAQMRALKRASNKRKINVIIIKITGENA